MSVTPLTSEEITSMLAKPGRGMIGKGKSVHLTKGVYQTYCGKNADTSVEAYEGETLCKRCYTVAEKNYRRERKISYGVMRDQELDRMTYGGKPFTKEEETEAIEDAMQYAGRTTNADIAILTADGFVECTPEILESALTELVDGPMSGQFDDYDYAADICEHGNIASVCIQCEHSELDRLDAEYAEADICINCKGSLSDGGQHDAPCWICYSDGHAACQCAGQKNVSEEWHVFAMEEWHSMDYVGYAPVNILIDGTYREIAYRHHAGDCNNMCVLGYELLEDNSESTMIVEAHLFIETEGIKVDLGWHTFYVSPLNEKSIQQMYGETNGEWKRPGEPDWDSVIIVEESETY